MADEKNASITAEIPGTEENANAIVDAIKTILGGVEIFHDENNFPTKKNIPKFNFYDRGSVERKIFIEGGKDRSEREEFN